MVNWNIDGLRAWTEWHFVSEIQDVFHQLSQQLVDEVLLVKTKQKYGLWLVSNWLITFYLTWYLHALVCPRTVASWCLSCHLFYFVMQCIECSICFCFSLVLGKWDMWTVWYILNSNLHYELFVICLFLWHSVTSLRKCVVIVIVTTLCLKNTNFGQQ